MAQYINLKQDEIDAIASRYGLEVSSYQPIDEGAGNTNYLLQANRENYVLTVFEIEHSRVVHLVRLLGTLEAHAFPTTRILKSKSGEAVTSCRGSAVLIKPYIPGQVILDLDENMLRQVGAAMAKLHEIPPPAYLPEKHAYGLAFFPGVFGSGIDPGYENWLAERYAALEKGIPSGLPRGLIHGDV
ncbi:MAG: phosphotransferase, partial [Chloroflexota bacterium]